MRMTLPGAGTKTWTGRNTARNEGRQVKARRTGIGRDRGRQRGGGTSRGSEKEGETWLVMTAKRREQFNRCSLLTPQQSSIQGSINPQSLCTVKSPKFSNRGPQRNNTMNPERDNMVLKFNSRNLPCSSSTTTRDSRKSPKRNSTLKDSGSVSSKEKSLQISGKTPGEISKGHNQKWSLRGSSGGRTRRGTRCLTQPSICRGAPLCRRPNREAWR